MSSGRRRRVALWAAGAYAVLLAASHLVQWLRPPASPPVHRQIVTIDLDGQAVRVAFVEQAGAGPAVVLLHGSPGSADDFRHLLAALVEQLPGRRLVALDLPGFGASTHWIADYGIDTHARATLAVMDRLGIDRAHVLGFSMGSGVGLHLADLAPDRVASLTMLAGIGLQEHEGSGDYHFERIKYALGYVGLVVLPEALPHFGLLGPRWLRHSFIRNFLDTDQRPLRGVLARLRQPVLIVHGARDPLVPVRAARAHHELVRQSELVVWDTSHFMVFNARESARVAAELAMFIGRVERGQRQRRTADPFAALPPPGTILPTGVDLQRLSPWTQLAAIIGSTYVLEDPTTVFVGLLVRAGQIDWFVAGLGVFLGIFSGDLLLYAAGWFGGRRLLAWRPVARRLPVHRVDALGAWFDRHGWSAVLASRFIPGSRLPLYVAAGALGRRPLRFAAWSCLAVMLWAPVMLILVVVLGEAASSPLRAVFGEHGWLAALATLVLLLAVLRVLQLSVTMIGRARLKAALGRLVQPEFWPAWLFYAPLVPWYAWLSLRHRSFTVWTLANPAIPHGGVVGESKFDILQRLPSAWCVPSRRIDADRDRLDHGLPYPLVLKPDAGQRGAGVKLARTADEAAAYLDRTPGPVLAQAYDPGPFEAGLFWYRWPGQPRGRLFAVTDKVFPVIEGDGRHTLEQLIWRHRRYRMQARVFLRRHELQRDRVLAAGERLTLAMAGNHCQGTMFRDGSALASEALRARLDAIVDQFPGFHIGRFDVRYRDPDALRRAEPGSFAIVELNGVTSEATNLYDPDWPLWRRYAVLFRQWSLLFGIGDAVRRQARAAGWPAPRPIHWIALLRMVRAYYRGRVVEAVSD